MSDSGRGVAARMNDKFKIVFTSAEPMLQLSGPMETQDELEAVREALAVLREWLPAARTQDERENRPQIGENSPSWALKSG